MSKQEQMVKALTKLSEAVNEISVLWEGDESGISEFDPILEQQYPFGESFFDIQHDIGNWVENAIQRIKEKV